MDNLNEKYFNLLFNKFQKGHKTEIVLHEPEKNITSNVICLPIANEKQLSSINIQKYELLKDKLSEKLNQFEFTILKMQAGLGSSVKRKDLIAKVENRTRLGAKGTDLYFKLNDQMKSISELQLLQAQALGEKALFKKVNYVNLVNKETEDAVDESSQKFQDSTSLNVMEDIYQKKMNTIGSDGKLTDRRKAPAGHGFVGFSVILDTFQNEMTNEIIAIGNGEDLCSTPDVKMINWVVENNIPITMLTTTKTEADKKGGQISIVTGPNEHVTIVEKAQAEESDQLGYFEALGLRPGDSESLFNTNIVIFNKKALKETFDKYLNNISSEEFSLKFVPDIIKNIKEQDGENFIQLESALGSVVLTLDRYFREEFKQPLVSFINLNVADRQKFFMPIKKRSDYDEIIQAFEVNPTNFQLVPKSE